ncbi:MAG: M48 family metallopeptidase [Longimicrobiales bacterium]
MTRYGSRIRRATTPLLLIGALGATATACSISTQQEVQMGRQYAAQINAQLPIVEDRSVNQYMNALGQQLARQGDRNLQYYFYVVNTDVVNAFAVPGGFVYVNRGLIEETDNLSELAGVLAHEISHVELRHSAEQMERAQSANLGLNLAYILLGRPPSGVEQAAIQVGGTAFFARYGREAELEADAEAVELTVQSGINPNGMVTFFKELLAERERRPSQLERWFSTHPLTEERITRIRQLIERYPARQISNLSVNTQAYENFKAQLARYPAPPPEYRAGR